MSYDMSINAEQLTQRLGDVMCFCADNEKVYATLVSGTGRFIVTFGTYAAAAAYVSETAAAHPELFEIRAECPTSTRSLKWAEFEYPNR